MKNPRSMLLLCLSGLLLAGCHSSGLNRLMGKDDDTSGGGGPVSPGDPPGSKTLSSALSGTLVDAYGNRDSMHMFLDTSVNGERATFSGRSGVRKITGVGTYKMENGDTAIAFEKMALSYPIPYYVRTRTTTTTDGDGSTNNETTTMYDDTPFPPETDPNATVSDQTVTITDGAARYYKGTLLISGKNVTLTMEALDNEKILLQGRLD